MDWQLVFNALIAFGVLAALFQDRLRALIWHPKLDLGIEPRPPDCHKTSWYYDPNNPLLTVPCYYYRLLVHNRAGEAARDVEVFVAEVRRRTSAGTWATFERFIPQYLVWSSPGRRPVYLPVIPPKGRRHCDVAHVLRPEDRPKAAPGEQDPETSGDKTVVSLDVDVQYLRRGHLLPPGQYQLTLEIAAANARPKTFKLWLDNPGTWHDDERTMLSEGVAIRLTS